MIAELLRTDRAGYPTDYVIARVRGRQGRPLSGTSDEEIWRALTSELAWLHGQVDPSLAARLSPLFALFELKTIVLAVRNRAIDRAPAVRAVLERSLLNEQLQAALRDASSLAAAIDGVVAALTRVAAPFGELTGAYAGDQLRGFEDALIRIYLEQAAAARLHPAVRRFVAAFIDARNVLLLHKQLRWNLVNGVRFIAGGTIAPGLFSAALRRGDPAAVAALVRQITGRRARVSQSALETTLLDGISRTIRPLRRHSEPAAVILCYVWQLYVRARNLSLIHHARDVEPDALTREVMQ